MRQQYKVHFTKLFISFASFILLATTTHAQLIHDSHLDDIPLSYPYEDDLELIPGGIDIMGCKAANAAQLKQVQIGNTKKQNFLDACLNSTNQSNWCYQLVRPNPESISTFRCTYGSSLPHQLIHPTESVWNYPIQGVNILKILENRGIRACEIYNWWRPEPYNQNAGGAPGRHPFGTAIDVDFCTKANADIAFNELCKLRKQGKIRAIGYYGGSSLHLGIGDKTANTWGRNCP